jgi:beta-galactosidase GanA
VRDYSAAAQKLFEGPAPAEMLKPELLKALNKPVVDKGSWKEVFGDDADEYFHAYSVAHYIGQVAAAGKAVNKLPLYVNAALRDPLSNPRPNTYESGGATDNVLAIWKVAAPAVDLLCPDIYLAGSPRYLKVIELYDRPDNTLFVPETSGSAENAKYIYSILARGGIGFSPFGIDSNGAASEGDLANATRMTPVGQEYAAIAPMMRELAQWGFDGKLKAAVELEDHASQTLDLGAWQAVVAFGGQGRRGGAAPMPAAGGRGRGRRGGAANTTTTVPQGAFGAPEAQPPATGKLLVAQLGENEFVTLGSNCRLTFRPTGANAGKAWQYLKVEEGQYENGTFKLLRIRNGDETDSGGPRYGSEPVVLHVTLVTR